MMSVSIAGIQKNRCRTTMAERVVETLAELPFTGDQVALFRAQPPSNTRRAAPPVARAHRSGNVLDLLLAQILKDKGQPVAT
jgi:hypothetical protein